MAVKDYDSPSTALLEPPLESLETLRKRGGSPIDDLAEPDPLGLYDLPDLDVIDDELTAPVVPVRADEFRCARCFLVLHRVMRSATGDGGEFCRDCA
jgi:hypothetical protein